MLYKSGKFNIIYCINIQNSYSNRSVSRKSSKIKSKPIVKGKKESMSSDQKCIGGKLTCREIECQKQLK